MRTDRRMSVEEKIDADEVFDELEGGERESWWTLKLNWNWIPPLN